MKTTFLCLILCTFFLFSCKKDSGTTNSGNYTGSYKGDINTYINGTLAQTLKNYTLVLVATSTPGEVTITNNLIITNSATISGNIITIPKTVAVTSGSIKVVEYGSGTFSGSQLTLELNQEHYSNNTLTGSGKWTGNLTKQ